MGTSGGPLETEMQHASPAKETFGTFANYDRESSPEDNALRSGQVVSGLGSKKSKRC